MSRRRARIPSGTSKPSLPPSMPTNLIWSRAGVGQTGSIHDERWLFPALFHAGSSNSGLQPQSLEGVSPMHTVFAMMLQSKSPVVSQPVYADNASIWHHMSDALHQSIYRVLSLLIAILPGILAFFVALAIFTLIGMGISSLLRRGLTWFKFDDRLARTRLAADWTPSSSPTEIVARGSFWACVLLGLIVG